MGWERPTKPDDGSAWTDALSAGARASKPHPSESWFWPDLNRDNGGRELLAEAEDGRGGVMSREAACQRDYHSLAAETATMWQHSEQTYGRVNWQQTRPQ